jgi:hypothetical protein
VQSYLPPKAPKARLNRIARSKYEKQSLDNKWQEEIGKRERDRQKDREKQCERERERGIERERRGIKREISREREREREMK